MLQVLLHGCGAAHGCLCCQQLLTQLLQGVSLSCQSSLHLSLLLCRADGQVPLSCLQVMLCSQQLLFLHELLVSAKPDKEDDFSEACDALHKLLLGSSGVSKMLCATCTCFHSTLCSHEVCL